MTPLLLFVFISAWREDKDFIWIARILKAFSVGSGTTFRESNLSSASFALADLKRVRFSAWENGSANMFHVRLKNARGLNYAWLIAVPERIRYASTERGLETHRLGQLTCTLSE